MRFKKRHLTIIVILAILFVVYITDFTLVNFNKRPLFVIKTSVMPESGLMSRYAGTATYYGLGYKVISWKSLEDRPINGKMYFGRAEGFEMSFFPLFQDIKKGPKSKSKLKFNKISEVNM